VLIGTALLTEEPPGETFVSEVVASALSPWDEDLETLATLEQAVLESQRGTLLPWLLADGDPARELIE
tara:strand:- start:87 stop:290 length:204 start_codon:yes stop_codon:yes gene_type:complete